MECDNICLVPLEKIWKDLLLCWHWRSAMPIQWLVFSLQPEVSGREIIYSTWMYSCEIYLEIDLIGDSLACFLLHKSFYILQVVVYAQMATVMYQVDSVWRPWTMLVIGMMLDKHVKMEEVSSSHLTNQWRAGMWLNISNAGLPTKVCPIFWPSLDNTSWIFLMGLRGSTSIWTWPG